MCQDHKTPHLRTYTVRTTPLPGLDLDSVRIRAQGFRWTPYGTLALWRRLATGAEQYVAEFDAHAVVDVFEEADAA